MNQALVLDIESVPLEASLRSPYPRNERNPPANYKSDEAISKWYAQDQAIWHKERAKECSVNPRLGRILCIGMNEKCLYAETEAEEFAILLEFWATLSGASAGSGARIVTWNGAWDLRFIVIRSLAHGLSVPKETRDWFRRYTYSPHMDCKAALLNWDVRVSGEGLSEWATFFGLGEKTGSGGDVYKLYLEGQHQKIKDYCLHDVALTAGIYERIKEAF